MAVIRTQQHGSIQTEAKQKAYANASDWLEAMSMLVLLRVSLDCSDLSLFTAINDRCERFTMTAGWQQHQCTHCLFHTIAISDR